MTTKIFTQLSLLISIILISFSCGDDSPSPTSSKIIPGVFAMGNAAKLSDVGAKVTRIILTDKNIIDLYAAVDGGTPLTSMERYTTLKAIHDAGIDIIVTIRWPESSDPEMDRVPTGSDRTTSLALLTRFLTDFGPLMKIYSLQNEVGTSAAPGSYSEANMTADGSGNIPAIAWWQDLLNTATSLINSNQSLSHLKIASPAPTLLKRAALLPESLASETIKKDFFYKTVAFAQSNNIYLDIHLLNFTLAQLETTLQFVKGIFQGEIIVTEWSDVDSVASWLDEPIDSSFKTTYSGTIDFTGNGLTNNRAFIEYTYSNNVSNDVWNDFAKLVPCETDFAQKSLEIMDKHGVVYACWALGYQYGEPLYDVKTLYSNLSTGSNNDKNTTVYNAIKSALINY